MIQLHRVLVDLLLNSLWQIPLLYLAAVVSLKLLRLSSPHVRQRLWAVTYVLCLSLPLLSAIGWLRVLVEHTLLHTRQVSRTVSDSILDQADRAVPLAHRGHAGLLSPSLANLLLALWFAWILVRLVQIAWALRRVSALTRNAQPAAAITPSGDFWARFGDPRSAGGVRLLASDQISMPATSGIWTPVILIPTALARRASDTDLHALLAHEQAHIARHDFLRNLLYELFAVPVSFHPVMRRLLARISEARELICDRIAAETTGNTLGYAKSLVQLSTLLLHPSIPTSPALGLFEGQTLEFRIMSLLETSPRSTRKWSYLTGMACFGIFAPCCLMAATSSFQPAALVAQDLQPYAGTWHWMFKGKPFVTMQLVAAGDHFTGYMTDGFFVNDNAGNMTDAGSEPGRSPIIRTFFSGNILHIVVQDDKDKSLSEWTMDLVAPDKAEFNTAAPDAPKNMKSWTAERAK